ncbi:hypothetical protein CDAR_422281 [Caerostris darwini]|uniref:Uncharacterized protein n=1 Tax=Caerostris darwini TaxID=1538125 RepID=A0AAV4WUY0_9ARAC|nr:hypothetical protein CDAR_422281 [Caerostris darwini]
MDDPKAPPSGKATHSSSSRCLRGPAYPQLAQSDTPFLLNNKIEPPRSLGDVLIFIPPRRSFCTRKGARDGREELIFLSFLYSNQNSQCNQFLPSMKIFMDDLKAPPSGKATHSSSSRCLHGPAYPQLDPSDTPSLLNNNMEPPRSLGDVLIFIPPRSQLRSFCTRKGDGREELVN